MFSFVRESSQIILDISSFFLFLLLSFPLYFSLLLLSFPSYFFPSFETLLLVLLLMGMKTQQWMVLFLPQFTLFMMTGRSFLLSLSHSLPLLSLSLRQTSSFSSDLIFFLPHSYKLRREKREKRRRKEREDDEGK